MEASGMTALTNRRDLLSFGGTAVALGALAAAPALALPVALAHSQSHQIAWDKAMAAFLAAQHAHTSYEEGVYRPLRHRLEALSPRPELGFYGPADRSGYRPHFHLYADDLHRLDEYPLVQVRDEAARIRDAWHDHRATAVRIGADAAADESERLGDKAAECERTLILMPAPDMTAFLWKIERMYGSESGRADGEESDGFCGAWTDALVADARRLA
jgi:hypothetical protein